MGKRLIVRQGERVVRHEIQGQGTVIGRDPSCRLFFSDHKLSRRHARLEPLAEGVRLVDLGSRNGTWVNEERVHECWLHTGDVIRLGGLHIEYQEDPPPPRKGEEAGATVVLDKGASTVVLEGVQAPEEHPERGPGGTAVLPGSGPSRDQSETVMLPRSSSAGPVESSGTFVYKETGEPETRGRRLPRESEPERPVEPSTEETLPEEESPPQHTFPSVSGDAAGRPKSGGTLRRLVWAYGAWCALVVGGVVFAMAQMGPEARWRVLALGWLLIGVGALCTSYLVKRVSSSAVKRLQEDIERVRLGRAPYVATRQSDEALTRVAEGVNRLIETQGTPPPDRRFRA